MKRRLHHLFLCILFFAGTLVPVLASHNKGAEIDYTYLGGNNYKIRLSFYRDCSGINAPTSVNINISSVSCNINILQTLPLAPGYPVQTSAICASQLSNTTCSGGFLEGDEKYVYEAIVSLPMQCTDWIFSYTDCCLPGDVTNILPNGFYVETRLNNVVAPDNNSPVLNTPTTGVVCNGSPFYYNFGAMDPDGDSLVFSLVNALESATVPATYTGGYSGINPMTSVPSVSLDPVNGDLFLQSTIDQVGVIAVLISEYRNGIFIGSVMRYMLIETETCSNNFPVFSSVSNLTGATSTGPFSVSVCPGVPMSFDLVATDADVADMITLTLGTVLPGATFSQTGTNPVTGTFHWTPPLSSIGYNYASFSAQDDNCPYLGRQTRAIVINVVQTTSAGSDLVYCPPAGPVTLNVVGGNSFTWSVLSGDPVMSCYNCTNPIVNPSVTTTYKVVSNLTSCNNIDTVVVSSVPGFSYSVTPDTTLCVDVNNPLLFNLGVVPTPADAYTYAWSPGAALSNPTSQFPVASISDTIDFHLVITSPLGCALRDTVHILTSSYDPTTNLALTNSTYNICGVDTVHLYADVNSYGICDEYVVSSIAHNPIAGAGTTVALGDDQVSAALPIGFDFNFYCNTYSEFYISSNGFITFNNDNQSGCCSGQLVPFNNAPNNLIAASWTDLNPGGNGTVSYFTTGTAPNRMLVVNYTDIPFCCGSSPDVTTQIILYEATDNIEIHTSNLVSNTRTITVGIENMDGTVGLAPIGRNAATFNTTNEAWLFSHSGNLPYIITWESPLGNTIGTGDTLTVSPVSTTTYFATLTDPTGECLNIVDSIVIQRDTTDPVAIAQNISVYLDAFGQASITAAQINNGSTDNCLIDTMTLSNYNFTCADLGSNNILFTVLDINNNSDTQGAIVTVVDTLDPLPSISTLPNLNVSCGDVISSPTATDNCTGAITGITSDPTSYSTLGNYVVTWVYDDGNGNITTQTQQVTVSDTIEPIADIASIDQMAECSVTLTAPTATDNCSGSITGTSTDPTTYSVEGSYTVIWTYSDANGNTSTQSQLVTIDDVTAPVPNIASLPNLSGCNVNVSTTPTAIDNCAGTITATTTDPLTYSTVGSYTVTWTYDDGNGNIATQTQSVTVIDCSGIEEQVDNSVSIYPNPSTGIFTVTIDDMLVGGVQIRLLDQLGQVLYTSQLQGSSQVLDFSYLPAATYYIQIAGDKINTTKTLIITQRN